MRIVIASILMGVAFGIQIVIRNEGYYMSEIELLVEYVYHHIATVISATTGVLIACSEVNDGN